MYNERAQTLNEEATCSSVGKKKDAEGSIKSDKHCKYELWIELHMVVLACTLKLVF